MKKLIFLLVALAPVSAFADLIRFDFAGKCTVSCEEIGMQMNDPVTGFVETETGLDDDTVLWAWELSDFGFSFGPNISISSSTHFALGGLVSNEDRTSLFNSPILEVMTFQQLFSNPSTGATTGSLFGALELDLSGWIASIRVRTCQSFFSCDTEFAQGGGPGSYNRTGYISVTEPGSLSLVIIGLFALFLSSRRRPAKTAQ